MTIETIDADVLCVGGGIAGLMAGIRASELGARVVVVEKGNARYSGAGRAGNDHFWCYIPEFHSIDVEEFVAESMLTQLGPGCASLSDKIVGTWMERSYEMVQLWERWGIPMKYGGKWEFAGHSFPGRPLTHLKYGGKYQKKVLTEKAAEAGVKLVNRVMVTDLEVDDNEVFGAVGLHTRDNTVFRFNARAVVLATGTVTRMYPGLTPPLIGNDQYPITLSGDGRSMAYRAGAELMDVEMIGRHVGLRYFARAGQATWIGVYRDGHGRPLGPYVDRPVRATGDILPEVDKEIFARRFAAGDGPIFLDCTGISDDDFEYMKHWLVNEGNEAVLNYLAEHNIDPRSNPLEFMTYPMEVYARIWSNERSETSVKGLFSAGDETTFSISGATVFGWIAGEEATKYVNAVAEKGPKKSERQPAAMEKLVTAFRSRAHGPDWKDANFALQQVMCDYGGPLRSELMLNAGLKHLRELRHQILQTGKAVNAWEVIRYLEVLNLYDLGELIMLGALERKESRGLHRRADFPITDPLLNTKKLCVRRVDGEPAFVWRSSNY